MKKTVKQESTGIYTRTIPEPPRMMPLTTPAQIRAAARARKKWVDRHNKNYEGNIHKELATLERVASGIIERHKGKLHRLTSGAIRYSRLAEDAPPIARRADELLDEATNVRRELFKIEKENPEAARAAKILAHRAYTMGRRAEMVKVTPFEPAAKIGRQVRLGGSKGRKRQEEEGTFKKEYKDLWPEIRERFKQVRQRNPHFSRNYIAVLVAKRFIVRCTGRQISPRTVLRHTTDL